MAFRADHSQSRMAAERTATPVAQIFPPVIYLRWQTRCTHTTEPPRWREDDRNRQVSSPQSQSAASAGLAWLWHAA